MKSLHNPAGAETGSAPTGQVLKGQYAGAYRSGKGKIKGLLLQIGATEHTVKLPKYLRPMLLRELAPGEFIQVWVYPEDGPEDGRWRGINILPLPACEAEGLQQQWGELVAKAPAAQPKRLCLEVCTKGKCSKQGGRQLHAALQDAVSSDPNLSHVSIKGTGCMKACKHGPNLRLPDGHLLHRATPAEALSQVALGQ